MNPVIGIITEYNPFHNGHLYQIKYVRQQYPDAPLVIAMSGNFLERGEPAIIDKWHRAAECLDNGADLVMELPLLAVVQPADRFAYYGIWTLLQMGVTDLFFGAEHAEYDFLKYAQLVKDVKGDFTKHNESFAKTYQRMITAKIGHSVVQPNDLLGLAYAKADLKLQAHIELHPLQRKNANYHDIELEKEGTIASASAIRKALFCKEEAVQKFIPPVTFKDLQTEVLVSWNDLWPYLKYELLTQSATELSHIYGMSEGIQYRMITKAQHSEEATSYDEWIHAVKNKRFTYTRLSRLATMILLHVTADEMLEFQTFPYLRILGFTRKGQQVIHNIKKNIHCPLVTNVSQREMKTFMKVDYRAGKIYQLVNRVEQDLKRSPILKAVK